MNSSPAEYLPDAHSNGNAKHDPKFGIVRALDPDTTAILDMRDRLDADCELNGPEKAFLSFAINRCLKPRFYADFKKGVSCIADSIVAQVFNVTERTVYNWRHKPAVRNYVWFSKHRRPDKWAMMVYHLTCLHPAPAERTEWRDPNGGAYAAGSSARPAEPDAGAALRGREKRNAALAEKRAQKTLLLKGGIAVVPKAPNAGAGGVTGKTFRLGAPKKAVLQAISARARILFRRTAEKDFGGQPKNFSADSRKTFRRTAETDFGSGPKKISAAGRKTLPPSAETQFRDKESQLRDQRLLKEEGRPPAPGKGLLEGVKERFPELADWLQSFNGAFRSRVEKTRDRIAVQLRAAAPNQKPAIKRKLAALDELLDGPAPPPPEKAPAPTAAPQMTAGPVRPVSEAIAEMRKAAR